MRQQKFSSRQKLFTSLKIITGLFLASTLIAMLFGFDGEISGGNVAVIPLHGAIGVSDEGGFMSGSITSEKIIESLDKADKNPNIKAILIDINSPGGSPVGTDEISQKIKSINKTTVAVIRETGASGAYWIATSTDYIFANRMSLIGSIGVYGSYLDFSGLLSRYNVTYQRFVSGDYKDMGSPFREPSDEEKEILQKIIDKLHVYFIKEVSENRNLGFENVSAMATGEIFLGEEAMELGLIDRLGTKEDALAYIGGLKNMTAVPVSYAEKKSFSDLLAGFSFVHGSGPAIGKFINAVPSSLELS